MNPNLCSFGVHVIQSLRASRRAENQGTREPGPGNMDERRSRFMKDFRCRGREDGMMIFVELQFEVMDLKATGHRKDESSETVGIVSQKHELSEVPSSFLGRMPKPSIQCIFQS